LLHQGLRRFVNSGSGIFGLILLGLLPAEVVEVIADIGPLTLPDAHVMDDRPEQCLPRIEIYLLLERALLHEIHQLGVFTL
jgi:hypothetical protein